MEKGVGGGRRERKRTDLSNLGVRRGVPVDAIIIFVCMYQETDRMKTTTQWLSLLDATFQDEYQRATGAGEQQKEREQNRMQFYSPDLRSNILLIVSVLVV